MRYRRTKAGVFSSLLAAILAVTALPALAHGKPAATALQMQAEPNQVQNVTVVQGDGYATLAWTHVDGATDYQIERTPVAEDGSATGNGVIVGLWRPNRQINNDKPTFADAGFAPGDRFQWRVRARFGTEAQPYSAAVVGTTKPHWGDPNIPGQNLRTQWEQTLGAQYTSDVNEYAYTAAIDELSDRVRVTEIGRTVLNRPINMFIIGYPKPPATPEAVAATSPLVVNCNVHGNEPGDREACFIMARQLAFTQDRATLNLLSKTTVLIVPTINGDGRAANSRGNSTGQDLNRDHSLIRQPETQAFAEMVRDYRPIAGYDGHEYGNANTGDLPMLSPRHANVPQGIFDESQDMIEGHMYTQGAKDGWWACPYGCTPGATVGLGQETILRNTLGLKNVVNSLLELRSSGGPTRPNESNTANNRRRKTYSGLWTFNQFFQYHGAQLKDLNKARAEAIQFQSANTGPIVLEGSREIKAYPAPHPGEAPPPVDAPREENILQHAPCAYKLTEEQYNGARTDGPGGQGTTVAQRLAAHGWKVIKTNDGYIVPLSQPQRGLVPLLLDEQAVAGLVAAERIMPTVTGTRKGALTVSGVTCIADATVRGAITVKKGATLIATGSTINGLVNADRAAGFVLTDSKVNAMVNVLNTAGPVIMVGNKISGSVLVHGTKASGPANVANGVIGAPLVAGNTLTGLLTCTSNAVTPVNLETPNTVRGLKIGQCARI
ncbi:hypothetical protein GCM10009541_29790 [Micromonospora gifhornensis]|uniref:Peptidase M14 domain-containing protein n=1 Tax=Micromonospora gifhornensis TaxID=84594 RepID=A0ABQ4IFL6_9ACTN|nr:M14 family metallocarboxypeptidase [Micromonospora gifhornensis]GIJ16696.1 hypothetical protein Vgi01_33800 [Micromonospora gifhornensis]